MKVDRIAAICVFMFGALYLWATLQLKEPLMRQVVGPKVFPSIIAVGLMLSAIALFLHSFRATGSTRELEPKNPDYRTMAIVFVGILAYALVLERLGYLLSTVLFLVVMISSLETDRHQWLKTVAVSVATSFAVFWLFNNVLEVRLPGGILG